MTGWEWGGGDALYFIYGFVKVTWVALALTRGKWSGRPKPSGQLRFEIDLKMLKLSQNTRDLFKQDFTMQVN